jgi:hypothetical protein
MVKTVKDLFRRAKSSGEEPLLSVQTYRATPMSHKLPSPAEMLFGRKIRTTMPVKNKVTDQQQVEREIKIDNKRSQQDKFDKMARTFEELQEFQKVLVQLDKEKSFRRPATIVKVPSEATSGPRTYQVQTQDGARYFRNRRCIRISKAGAVQDSAPNKDKEPCVPTLPKTPPRVTPGTSKGSTQTGSSPKRLPEPEVIKPSAEVIPPEPPATPTLVPIGNSRSLRANRGVPPIRYEPECFLPKARMPGKSSGAKASQGKAKVQHK